MKPPRSVWAVRAADGSWFPATHAEAVYFRKAGYAVARYVPSPKRKPRIRRAKKTR